MQNSEKTILERAVEASKSSEEIKFVGSKDFCGLEETYRVKQDNDKLGEAILASINTK